MAVESKKNKRNSGIIMMSRVRLARNLAGEKFSNAANDSELERVYDKCVQALSKVKKFKDGEISRIGDLSEFNKELLLENRAITKELIAEGGAYRGVAMSKDGDVSAMINEEDHLRIQAFAKGDNLASAWRSINALDNSIERNLEYAFCREFGYQTACPTNVGTGMRASLMMHLPALVMNSNLEKIVRGINLLGMVMRGANGEGSDSYGSIFQLSNQQTLGMSEMDIIKRIIKFGKKIAEFETNARVILSRENPLVLADKFARAKALLENCKLINTAEAMANLSILRLAADMGYMMSNSLERIDFLMREIQPSHLQIRFGFFDATATERDSMRASFLNCEVPLLGKIKRIA